MKRGTRGEATLSIAVPPDQLYALVSDVTRMGEWSPETRHCEWIDGATGPAVGAQFKGTNKNGIVRWSTKPRVAVAEPGREFAFVTSFAGKEATRWSYRFEPDGNGTKVTESFEVLSDVPWYVNALDRYVMRIKDRQADLEANMQRTLERIKATAEGSASD